MERLKSAVAGLLLPAGQFTTEELELPALDETLLLDDVLVLELLALDETLLPDDVLVPELLALDETLLSDDTLEFDSAPLGDAPSPPPPPPPQADRIPEKKTTTHPRTTDFI